MNIEVVLWVIAGQLVLGNYFLAQIVKALA